MILRDAIVSSERHRLGVVEPARLDSQPEPLAAELTIGEVCAWLRGEDEAARRACADQLAPELDTLREAARIEGYTEGQAAAKRDVAEQTAAVLEHLRGVVQAFEIARQKAADELADTCAAVVAEAFVKLAGECLVTPAATLGAVRSVLSRVRDGRHYIVYVHPNALAAVEAERVALQAAIGDATLDLQSDAALSGGGCRVESDLGTLDAAFDVQLHALFATLRAAHSQHAEPR